MDTLNEKGVLTFDFDGNAVELSKEDLMIDTAQTEGYVTEGDNTVTVVLDTRLTPELLEEGFYRELVSKIQTMRKEAGFEVMDHIYVYVDKNDKISILLKSTRKPKGRGNGGQHHSGRHDRIHKGMEYQRRGLMLGVAKVTK